MSNSGPAWFGARLIFESVHPGETVEDPLFEDRVILVRALDEEEARHRASLGKDSTHEYENMYGNRVVETFREVLDIVQLFDDPLSEGSQVYYNLMGLGEVAELRRRFAGPGDAESP